MSLGYLSRRRRREQVGLPDETNRRASMALGSGASDRVSPGADVPLARTHRPTETTGATRGDAGVGCVDSRDHVL